MPKFSASDAAFAGFRLVREHPKAVGVWALFMTVASAIATLLSIHFWGPQVEAFAEIMQDKSADPEAIASALTGMMPMMLWTLPYNLFVQGVMLAAINRVILAGHDSRNAYLRIGRDELRQVGVLVFMNLIMIVVLTSAAVLSGLFIAIGGPAALLSLVAFVGGGCLMIYLAVRLSLASPMTFDTQKVSLRRSMPMTKGLFAPLIGAYALAIVMAIIVWLLTMVIVSAITLIVSGDFATAGSVMRSDATSLETYFSAAGVVQTLFAGVVGTLVTLILSAPAPVIYQILKAGGAAQPVDVSV